MKVKVYNMYTVRKTEDREHLISVRNPVDWLEQYKTIDSEILPTFDSALTIFCDDVTRDEDGCKLFNEEDARAIIDFVGYLDLEREHIAIHCSAGMSRSVAIGAFLRDFYGADVTFTVTGHDDYRNIHMYNVLRRVHFEKHYNFLVKTGAIS